MDSIFKHTENNGEAIITGLQRALTETSIFIPETINGIPVVEIGPEAFRFTSITDIKIGENIKKIGEKAFYMCEKLQSVTWHCQCDVIPVDCFSGCSNLTQFDFSNIKRIEKRAFSESGLQKVCLPQNIECIIEGAFSRCKTLSSVKWNCKCDVIPTFCFYKCRNLTQFDFSKIKKVEKCAFSESGLQKVCLPQNIECISGWTFSKCKELRSVEWNCKCDVIPVFCFLRCSNLTQFDFSNIKRIDRAAFYESGLKEVCLPENIECIIEGAFCRCKTLSSVKWNCKCNVISVDCFAGCSNLTQFDFSNIKRIGAHAFENSGLTSVRLSKETAVDQSGFACCNDLEKIEWLSGRSIEGDIFEECQNIKEIIISDNVMGIAVDAFASSPNAEISFI